VKTALPRRYPHRTALAPRAVGRLIAGSPVGSADGEARPELEPAGVLRWRGYLPNAEAMRLLDGALAGLSLLHDQPNYRHSQPTKVIEYMAHGVPVLTTPCHPPAPWSSCTARGLVVRSATPPSRRRCSSCATTRHCGSRPRGAATRSPREQIHWPNHAKDFVRQLEEWAH
jgi:hypothetical protein